MLSTSSGGSSNFILDASCGAAFKYAQYIRYIFYDNCISRTYHSMYAQSFKSMCSDVETAV